MNKIEKLHRSTAPGTWSENHEIIDKLNEVIDALNKVGLQYSDLMSSKINQPTGSNNDDVNQPRGLSTTLEGGE